jgi:hypothetical protein
MLYKAEVAVCSEIRTKHINAMWAPWIIFECEASWYVKLPLGFKRLMFLQHSIDLPSTAGFPIFRRSPVREATAPQCNNMCACNFC